MHAKYLAGLELGLVVWVAAGGIASVVVGDLNWKPVVSAQRKELKVGGWGCWLDMVHLSSKSHA